MVASALSSRSVFAIGSVVSCEPDLVHPVIQRDDAILWDDLSYIVHNALRGRWPTIFGRAVGQATQDAFAKAEQGPRVVQSSLNTVGQQLQARSDITNHFALRKVDSLHVGGGITNVNHLRALRTHDERRLLNCVVPDGNDQVGAINSLVHVVTFAKCGRAHIELASPRHCSFSHLRREEGNLRAADESPDACRAPRARCGGAQHNQRPLRL